MKRVNRENRYKKGLSLVTSIVRQVGHWRKGHASCLVSSLRVLPCILCLLFRLYIVCVIYVILCHFVSFFCHFMYSYVIYVIGFALLVNKSRISQLFVCYLNDLVILNIMEFGRCSGILSHSIV